jgi:hypothetical protein
LRGIEHLLESQNDDGNWLNRHFAERDPVSNHWVRNDVHCTAWGLSALSKWTVAAGSSQPSGVNKLSLRLVGTAAGIWAGKIVAHLAARYPWNRRRAVRLPVAAAAGRIHNRHRRSTIMGRVNDTISNVNSALRNLLLLVLIGGAGLLGYKGYDLYNAPQKQLADKEKQLADKSAELDKAHNDLSAQKKQLDDLNTELIAKKAENEKLQIAMKLLKVQHRLARMTVLGQREIPSPTPAPPGTPPETSAAKPKLMTKIEFVEINDQGQPIGQPKQFDIDGDIVYVDYWTVNFEDKYVEQSDLDRSTSLALFRRIFGEHQEPINGYQLDTVGTRPTAYSRGSDMSDFEKKIWNDFWLIANDRDRAEALGIHAIQGKAVSMRVQPGKIYEIELRSTGNMTIRPVDAKTLPADEAKNGS